MIASRAAGMCTRKRTYDWLEARAVAQFHDQPCKREATIFYLLALKYVHRRKTPTTQVTIKNYVTLR